MRILAIALIPSLTLLVSGVGAAGYLVHRTRHTQALTEAMQTVAEPDRTLIEQLQTERRLTMQQLAGDPTAQATLADVRPHTDLAFRQLATAMQPLQRLSPTTVRGMDQFTVLVTRQLVDVRQRADDHTLSLNDAYAFYSRLLQMMLGGAVRGLELVTDPEVVIQLARSDRLIHAIEAASRSHALTAAALQHDAVVPLPDEYLQQVGTYHNEFDRLTDELDPPFAPKATHLREEPQWAVVTNTENALVQRSLAGSSGAAPTISPADWHTASDAVDRQLLDLWDSQNHYAHSESLAFANRTVIRSVLLGIAVVLLAIATLVVSLVLANRFIRRLRRLRTHTMAIADEHLPDMMRRLRSGDDVDPEAEISDVDFGRDEIGAVASAFQHAHAAAVTAAITERRTQIGVRAVFSNIAHRSQLVVHRQLEILDEAERREEDPAILDTLFALDHLATRQRRNAENLIILAGGQPGRQWRSSVALVDVIRSAIGETVDYARVRLGRMPQTRVTGIAVSDVIHLIAELLDNATSFSPPQARVDIASNPVGKGVAVEITDQGMGMDTAALERSNELLRNPPDFGVATFSADSRLGHFVVGRLASRHSITVRLVESDYGGVRAIVVIPRNILDETAEHDTKPIPRVKRTPPISAENSDPQPERDPRAPTPRFAISAAALSDPRVINGSIRPTTSESPSTPAPSNPPASETLPDGRPALPQRNRQAPRPGDTAQETLPPAPPPRPAEQARDLMAAIENGTRQGRRPLPSETLAETTEPAPSESPATETSATAAPEEQER